MTATNGDKTPKKITNSRKRPAVARGGGAKRQKQIGVVTKFKEKKKVKRRKKKRNVADSDEDSDDDENERSFNDPHANGHVEIDGSFDGITNLNVSVATGLAKLRAECKANNINTHVLNFVSVQKQPSYRPPGTLNFLCLHNNCGKLDPRDCPSLMTCCHKAFTIAYDRNMSKTAVVRAAFMKTENGVRDRDHPSLRMKWNKWLLFNNDGEIDIKSTADGFRQWRANTLRSHLIQFHPTNKLPYCATKDLKDRARMRVGKDIQYCTFIGKKEKRIGSVDIDTMYDKLDSNE